MRQFPSLKKRLQPAHVNDAAWSQRGSVSWMKLESGQDQVRVWQTPHWIAAYWCQHVILVQIDSRRNISSPQSKCWQTLSNQRRRISTPKDYNASNRPLSPTWILKSIAKASWMSSKNCTMITSMAASSKYDHPLLFQRGAKVLNVSKELERILTSSPAIWPIFFSDAPGPSRRRTMYAANVKISAYWMPL